MAGEDQLSDARAVAFRRLPWLKGAILQEVRTGMDTYTPDRRPIVGPVPGVNGLYAALAFNGCGVKVAPAIGALVCDHLTGESTESDADLLPARFFRQHNVPVTP
jgi:glycine/D-amino acid oxidase-like deaminating enzyme